MPVTTSTGIPAAPVVMPDLMPGKAAPKVTKPVPQATPQKVKAGEKPKVEEQPADKAKVDTPAASSPAGGGSPAVLEINPEQLRLLREKGSLTVPLPPQAPAGEKKDQPTGEKPADTPKADTSGEKPTAP